MGNLLKLCESQSEKEYFFLSSTSSSFSKNLKMFEQGEFEICLKNLLRENSLHLPLVLQAGYLLLEAKCRMALKNEHGMVGGVSFYSGGDDDGINTSLKNDTDCFYAKASRVALSKMWGNGKIKGMFLFAFACLQRNGNVPRARRLCGEILRSATRKRKVSAFEKQPVNK